MATIDTARLDNRSTFAADHGRVARKMDDGVVRIQSLYAAPQYDVALVYSGLTTAQRTAKVAWVAANFAGTHTFTHPVTGEVYTLTFADKPIVEAALAGGLWDVTLNMRGTRA